MTCLGVAPKLKRFFRFLFLSAFALWLPLAGSGSWAAEVKSSAPESGLNPILTYISSGWDTLTRPMTDCQTVVDPKLTEASVLYLPADFPRPPAVQELQKRCKVEVQPLPAVVTAPGQIDPSRIAPGLLYLENKYVVPGGRFNEMYGWDSYFIILGLLRAGRIDLARGMVDNFFFEIEHYGTILNANRAYYLTRSQPPFLTSMIMAVYDADKAAGHENRAWLEKAYGYASKDYESWNREPHVAGSTGLSRYLRLRKRSGAREFEGRSRQLSQGRQAIFCCTRSRGELSRRENAGESASAAGTAILCSNLRRCQHHGQAGVREHKRQFLSARTTTRATGRCANPASTSPFALDPMAQPPIITLRSA